MAAPYRLLAVDMDGTLLDPAGRVTPGTAAAVAAATAAGVQVVLASGRAPREMTTVHQQLALTTPFVAFNGALVLAADGREVLHHEPIDLDTARRIAVLLKEHDSAINLHVETQDGAVDHWNVEALDERMLEDMIRWQIAPPHSIGEVQRILGDETSRISKLWFYAPADAMAAIKRRIVAELHERVATLAFDDVTLTILSTGVSKASGVAWVAKRAGICQAEVLAIGDDLNDVPLLGWAGLGVAMGNARPSARAVAAAVTASNAEDGVAAAIRRWVLAHVPA